MPNKSLHFCNHFGCGELTADRYCKEHMEQFEARRREQMAEYDGRRGSAQERGYTARWQKYSKQFLGRPENQICVLHLDSGCAIVAQCVDHIDPPDGPNDPRFWATENHQGACIHCNSVKGHRKLIGTYDILDGNRGK
jgi:5-methylcytosine-specific restriction protein A